MESKFSAVVFRAQQHGEYDKLLKLITKDGVVSAIIKGVRRAKAKLKPCALPFAFFEYTAVKKGDLYVVTGASQIEDLHGLSACPQKLTAGSIILESAAACFGSGFDGHFIIMLKKLKDIIYGLNPFTPAIRFLQHMIHSGGYGYEYEKYNKIETPLQLLSYLHYSAEDGEFDEKLILKTLAKLIISFENIFECTVLSKIML